MPIYEFRCKKCGSVREEIRPLGDTGSGLTCRLCGDGPLERVPSTFAATGSLEANRAACGGPGGFS